jgi:hypothetical protein
MNELEQLIAEQARDMRLGPYQKPQAGVVPLHDSMVRRLDNTGTLKGKIRDQYVECVEHGRTSIRQSPRGPWCLQCNNRQTRAWRVREPETFRRVKREADKRFHARHKDSRNAKARAAYARKRALLKLQSDGGTSVGVLRVVRDETEGVD